MSVETLSAEAGACISEYDDISVEWVVCGMCMALFHDLCQNGVFNCLRRMTWEGRNSNFKVTQSYHCGQGGEDPRSGLWSHQLQKMLLRPRGPPWGPDTATGPGRMNKKENLFTTHLLRARYYWKDFKWSNPHRRINPHRCHLSSLHKWRNHGLKKLGSSGFCSYRVCSCLQDALLPIEINLPRGGNKVSGKQTRSRGVFRCLPGTEGSRVWLTGAEGPREEPQEMWHKAWEDCAVLVTQSLLDHGRRFEFILE